jgi:hypothetical protein
MEPRFTHRDAVVYLFTEIRILPEDEGWENKGRGRERET